MYNKEIKNNDNLKKAQELANTFAELEGRRPRIMIANLEKTNNETITKTIAAGYADVGFDVDICPLSQSPQEIAKQAIENDVHVLAIASINTEQKPLIPQLIDALKNYTRDDILVIVYSEISEENQLHLVDSGVSAVLNPNTIISDAAIQILEILTN